MAEIQFGVNLRALSSQEELRQLVRRVDDLGYDVVAAPDHLNALAPFTALVAAALISPRLRLRTYVLNVGFWNPALLARRWPPWTCSRLAGPKSASAPGT
jgi:alkanesulfonate monooxygenase SsuD/methylene tetrahydromethanopterin reductase-like flavin-dependent oxidoreductase (luciferase family)